jgi:kojibiose phosphorylase
MTPRTSILTDPYAETVRIWCRDREIHLSADIVYAIWHYWQATGDDSWLCEYGAEIIFDTAIFWISRLEWHVEKERYELCDVIGADEYHEKVDNNAFTNRMVQWHLEKAVAVYDWLQQNFPDRSLELRQKLQLTSEHLQHWQTAIAKIYIPYDDKTELIEQFEGFFQLQDIDLKEYEPRLRSIQAVLGIDETNQRQVLKQPDVLMLLYLMRDTRSGLSCRDILQKNWDYYAPRTDITYGSSLTPAIHATLAANLGKAAEADELFMRAALVDLEDNRGNTEDGIHAASTGGVWQAVVFGFGGIQLLDNAPVATPHLPPTWTRLKFKLNWRGTWHCFDLKPSHSPVSEIKGFIFDLDGVLTDTAEFHYLAWQKLADEEKLPFDRKANEALRGVSRRESLLLLVGDRAYSEAQIQEMMERKNRYYVDSITTITPKNLLAGGLEFLKELRQAGIKIAIGSASKNARSVIEKLHLSDYVDAIADGNSVQHPKPAPDLFLYAADLIGLKPSQCVVVEDAAVGIEAAIAAGMWAVGIGSRDRFKTANVILPNLIDVRWSDLQLKLKESLADK